MSSTKNLNENLEVMNCKQSNKEIDPIRDGLLSVRALNCCRRLGINSINELVEYVKFNDLYNIRNCGQKTVLELNDASVRYAHYNMESIPFATRYFASVTSLLVILLETSIKATVNRLFNLSNAAGLSVTPLFSKSIHNALLFI